MGGELGVNEGNPVVFADGVREHASLRGGKLFECGFGLCRLVGWNERWEGNFEDSAGREEDLVCVDIAEEPYTVGLEGDLEPWHPQP